MIFHTVYRTQNVFTGKYYFGVHKTNDPYDGYLGSGTVLRRAIKKHGEQAFIKNVCFIFDNPEEAFAKEFELIEEYRADPLCYNLRQGGSGGFDWINRKGLNNSGGNNLKANQAIVLKIRTNASVKAEYSSRILKAFNSPNRAKAVIAENESRRGSRHTKETKLKISKAATQRVGTLNGRYRMKWFYNPLTRQSKCAKPNEFEALYESGWVLGRRMKHEDPTA